MLRTGAPVRSRHSRWPLPPRSGLVRHLCKHLLNAAAEQVGTELALRDNQNRVIAGNVPSNSSQASHRAPPPLVARFPRRSSPPIGSALRERQARIPAPASHRRQGRIGGSLGRQSVAIPGLNQAKSVDVPRQRSLGNAVPPAGQARAASLPGWPRFRSRPIAKSTAAS